MRSPTFVVVAAVVALCVIPPLLLYAYRGMGPSSFPLIGAALGVLSTLFYVLVAVLVVLLVRRMSRAADPYERLAKIADLRDRGVLTQDEFESEKRKIMG